MHVKHLATMFVMLGCASVFAKAPDKEVWITLDAEAIDEVSAAFQGAGQAEPALGPQKEGVAAIRVRESQLRLISEVMHDKFNRCGGFVYHDSEQQAQAALSAAAAPAPTTQLAANYTLDNPTLVSALQTGLTEPNIRATITHLSSYTTRYYTSTTGVNAATWLRDQWLSMANGRSDVSVAFYNHTGWAQPSVIATITGTTFPSEIIVIGGHLDSTNSSGSTLSAPGADDDASGIATLTEVFRNAMVQGYRPAKTVKFMAYAAEEVGLRGSSEIANAHKAAAANVIGVLQLDMTNYRGSSVDVGIVTDRTNAAQNTFIQSLIDTYVPGVTWATTSCGYACSDHASWTTAGYAASIPFEALMNQHNSAIHTANDTLARSAGTADHSLKFARIAAAYVAELAEGSTTPPETTPPTVALTAPAAGSSVTGTAILSATASDASGISRVEFLVDGVVRGTVATSPYNFAWDSASVSNGSHTIAARAFDGVGNQATTAAITVTVSNASSSAAYDSTLKTPRCFSVSNACDSGTLLNGRGNLGPEPSFPNTINGSCADGLSGAYHSDESNDRIKVSTVDGTPFAAGKQVRVEATAWVYSTTADRLDLYYAANANSPVWTLIGTVTPPGTGLRTMSATYTLPAGTVQAVRARFRYNGTPAACGTGSYNDHDDLVFAVQ
ncbi:MAG TPA: M20/M25/M40 family metallo-hydrolase [Myxococcus sp.]|nr:M20/M25/M40 family metallo-hydrolase [Myxococcus sp.]